MAEMSEPKACPNCRGEMKLSVRTLGFLSFQCPKYAFVVIEVAKENGVPQGRTKSGRR
jgi:hypothetical protein